MRNNSPIVGTYGIVLYNTNPIGHIIEKVITMWVIFCSTNQWNALFMCDPIYQKKNSIKKQNEQNKRLISPTVVHFNPQTTKKNRYMTIFFLGGRGEEL